VIGFLFALLATVPPACPPFEEVAAQVWEFRARTMPFSADDIPRLERPAGLVRSWSKESVNQQRAQAGVLAACLTQVTAGESAWPLARRVDVRLIRSALARVHWELDVNRRWERDPGFYLDQALTPVLELLTEPPPIGSARARELVTRLRNVPSLLQEGKANLQGEAVPLFAQLALAKLVDIRQTLHRVATSVLPLLPKDASRSDFSGSIVAAADALESFR
jgi:hypothetical protein